MAADGAPVPSPLPTVTGRTARGPQGRRVALGALVLVLVIAALAGALQWRARRLTLDDQQLGVALATFRGAGLRGQADTLPTAELLTDDQVRADPARCLPLVRLAPEGGAGAQSWSGASGRPLQPVRLLTVRFADPAAARAALAAKRTAVRRCDTVQLAFPPFDQPAETFTVSGDGWWWLPGDRLTYRLHSDAEYLFYVRRYGNTLTWSWANQSNVNDSTDGQVRRAVVDDLVARLQDLVQR